MSVQHLATPVAVLTRWDATSGALLGRLRALVQRVDAWLLVRRRAAVDRHVLATMSDRELRDIGVDRGSVQAIAAGRWRRDYPG